MTDLADGDWRLVRAEGRAAPMQMALDEVAAETAAAGGAWTARVYRWAPSGLSLGYRQDPATVDWAYCEREGIDVTRRQTGGGGIYHDHTGDISYSIAVPAAALPDDLMASYDLLCEPILDAFERMNVEARVADERQPAIYEPSCYLRGVHCAHDILAGGRKISGNAQYRQRDVVIQHGSLSYALDPDRHLAVFDGHDVTAGRFRERVTAIHEQSGIDRDTAVAALEEALADWTGATSGAWGDGERERARDLAASKYGATAWCRDRTEPTT